MCSIGDVDILENNVESCMPQRENLSIKMTKCNKCRQEEPSIVLRGKDAYCRECFLGGVNHKFKVLLGKSRLIRPGDQVLINYELGHASTAMLNFVRAGLDLNTPKKLQFKPCILFIEDQYHLNLDARKDILNEVKKQADLFSFKVFFVSLLDYALKNCNIKDIIKEDKDLLHLSSEDSTKLNNIVSDTASKTTKYDMCNILKHQLLREAAKHLECKFVFLPDISSDLASNLLSNVSLGRGAHIALDAGFCDDRDSEVKLLRPMKMFDLKELVFYNVYNKIEPISVPLKEENPYSSVQNLMKKFVTDLQISYPATITTILKTGDKLAMSKEQEVEKCVICNASIARNPCTITSEMATDFSHMISTHQPNYNLTRQERYEEIMQNFETKTDSSSRYCYSCIKLSDYLLIDT